MNDDNEIPTFNAAMPTKLTDWEKEPSLRDLKQDFEAAQPYQNAQLVKIKHWNALRNVEGKSKPKAVKGRSKVQPKLIRRQAEWRYPALTGAIMVLVAY